MSNDNLFLALRAGFPADGDSVAIETDSGLFYSWRDLDRGSAMLANLLQSLNLPLGTRVAVQVEKSVEALMLYLATLRAGLVYLPLNSAYQRGEIAYFLANATPAVVVCTPERFSWVSQLAFAAGTAHVFTLSDARSGSLLQRALNFGDQQSVVARQASDVAAILYTSGTTGRSKGAMLTHGNLLSNARVLQQYWGWRADDVLLHALPLFHVHGLFVAAHGALLNGSRMLWMARFEPALALRLLGRSTVFMGVPTLYTRLLGQSALDARAVRGMRLFLAGSAPLLPDTFRLWQQRTGHTIVERYGMSETGMLTSNPYAPDPRYSLRGERRGGSVGFPLPGVDLRVCDEEGRGCGNGAIGGIEVRGPNVFAGYWQMPDKTAEEFTPDGYFRTGDVGFVDTDGYVHLVGRSKDLIISGGYNVYPAEIEHCINNLPGVAESAVVGVPDADFGEVGVALVVARDGQAPDPENILCTLRASLANFKVPKRCYLVAQLPRNAMGKVQKNLLRDQYRGAA